MTVHPEKAVFPEKSRMIVVETIYFQKAGRGPELVCDSRFSRELESKSSRAIDSIEVGPKLVHFVLKEDTGTVVLVNRKKQFRIIPTLEEQKNVDSLVIEVRWPELEGNLLVPPGEHLRLDAGGIGTLTFRCLGNTELEINQIPS